MSLAEYLAALDFPQLVSSCFPGLRLVNSPPNVDIDTLAKGGTNVHVPLELSDGSHWLARIGLTIGDDTAIDSKGKRDARRAMLCAEYHTMRWLFLAGVKVPDVRLCEGHDILLVSHKAGTALSAPIMQGQAAAELRRIIDQLADEYVKISRVPFASIGAVSCGPESATTAASLKTDSYRTCNIGPLLCPDHVTHGVPQVLGPYRSLGERWIGVINHCIERMLKHDLAAAEENAVLTYLVHWYVRGLVQRFKPMHVVEPAYIRHADDKGDQIMAADGHITGIIDWEWAYTTAACEAFTAPYALVNFQAFFAGDNNLGPEEIMLAEAFVARGRTDLAEHVRGGKVHQRLPMVVGQCPDGVQLCALARAMLCSVSANSSALDEESEEIQRFKGPGEWIGDLDLGELTNDKLEGFLRRVYDVPETCNDLGALLELLGRD